ncbi:hypothetical protein B296_00031909 [Ensete ventricosum]|uniref:Uncharacterized protein n=1 Tax=Ensete ventricosum TaxID=4639 RepID=A0A426ZHP6_ENSVE|nr:hypothetical protein B296_00031909 [Ensete ventricosum]
MIEVVEDDAVFLSLVEAAEAAVTRGSAKRQKVSSSSASAIPAASNPAVEEGSYMAALRGSHSSLWQQQQSKRGRKKENSNSGLRTGNDPSPMSSSTGGGACFKCGVAGHWARDCDAPRGRAWGGGLAFVGASSGREEGEVPEKACPCGSGSCLVRISNTAKNPGRKFYICPMKVMVSRDEKRRFREIERGFEIRKGGDGRAGEDAGGRLRPQLKLIPREVLHNALTVVGSSGDPTQGKLIFRSPVATTLGDCKEEDQDDSKSEKGKRHSNMG